jgi:hypothetical protein
MKLKIQVLDDVNEVVLEEEIDVPGEIPYPPSPAPQSGPISLLGLKTALDYYLFEHHK